MEPPDYFELTRVNGALRWNNTDAFIKFESSKEKESSKVLLAFVTFNASNAAIDVLRKILLDNQEVDILIVDNSSTEFHFKALSNEVANHQKVRLLQTSFNLGGAGGYALINEIFLRSSYKYLFLTEDDAVPVEPDLVTTIVEAREISDMVGCHYYNNKTISFSFHFTLYSRRLIETAGVPDPRFFQGGDDAEIRDRHLAALRAFGKDIHIVNRGYHHPTLKGMGTPAKVIRSQRNAILADLSSSRFFKFTIRVFLLNAYSLLNLFIGRYNAFKLGIFSFNTIKSMRHPGCILFKVNGIHDSLDKNLAFSSVPVNSLNSDAANYHLASLLNCPLSRIGSRRIILATLDSPWFIKNLILTHEFIVVKDLSTSLDLVNTAFFKPSMRIRIYGFISFLFALIILPLTATLYFVNYKLNFSFLINNE
jgi:hypothetical protein